MPRFVSLLLLVVGLAACADEPASSPPPASSGLPLRDGEIPVPADSGASAPRFSTDADGRPLLSWTQPTRRGDALLVSRWTGQGWGVPDTADVGTDRVVNPADTPGVTALADDRMLAHLLTAGPEPHTYDTQVRLWDGRRWSEPALLNTDGVAAEHGFMSVVPLADGGAGVAWLDGRTQAGRGGATMLRYAELAPDGARRAETELDARVCDCCPTAAAVTSAGLVVAYRDRSPDEIRDIAVVRLADGAWTAPVVPHPDGWRIEGCPVNGPALAARGSRVALAWFSAPDSARVQLAISQDGGATWGRAVRIDDGMPLGRVSTAVVADGRVAVTWLERVGEAAEVRLRVRDMAGTPPSRTIATVPAGRAAGIPRVTALGDRALVAWAEAGTLRTTLVSL